MAGSTLSNFMPTSRLNVERSVAFTATAPCTMPLDERIFRCFESHAVINGKSVNIGVDESVQLAREAFFARITKEDGTPKDSLPWLEEIVVLMRAATSGAPFNHEWWADQVTKPEWARLLDRYYGECWLYFPEKPGELTPQTVGNRLGYSISLGERRLEKATSQPSFLQKVESIELEKARRGFEPEVAEKVKLVIPGYDNWKQYADEEYFGVVELRKTLFRIATERASREEFEDFSATFNVGAKRARAVDLENQLSEFNETNEVAEILQKHWLEVEELQNRAEISDLIFEYLSPERKKFLQGDLPPNGGFSYKDGEQWLRFTDRLRDIYRKIGLKKAGKGRPRKNGAQGET